MTSPDLSRPHIVVGPHEYAENRWWGACTCGEQFYGTERQAIETLWEPHRQAARKRHNPAASEVETGGAGVG